MKKKVISAIAIAISLISIAFVMYYITVNNIALNAGFSGIDKECVMESVKCIMNTLKK